MLIDSTSLNMFLFLIFLLCLCVRERVDVVPFVPRSQFTGEQVTEKTHSECVIFPL